MNLSLTQRQACNLIQQLHGSATETTTKWMGLFANLSMIEEVGSNLDFKLSELQQFGIIGENLALHEVQLFDDAVSTYGDAITNPMRVYFTNVSWVQQREWQNINSSLAQKGAPNLVALLGQPIMDKITASQHATIVDYLKSIYDYGSSSFEADLCIEYLGVDYNVYHFAYSGGQNVVVTALSDAFDSSIIETLLTCLSYVSAMNAALSDIAAVLTNNICTPADLIAVLNKYVNSEWSQVRELASGIIASGSNSVSTALNTFIATYRSIQSVTENADGSLVWEASGHIVKASAWAIIGQVVSASLTVIGTVMMYSFAIIGAIVGGALMIAGSIVSSINTTFGQFTGQTPVICDEAIDDIYADPVFQGTERIQIDQLLKADDTMSNLRSNGRSKIVLPWCIIYLYNLRDEYDGYAMLDYKIFPRMTGQYFGYMPYSANCDWFTLRESPAYVATGKWHCAHNYLQMLQLFCKKVDDTTNKNFEVNSMNPASWKNFFGAAMSSTLMTCCMIFSSPVYRWNGEWESVTGSSGTVGYKYNNSIKYVVQQAIYYYEHGSLDNTDDIVLGIGSMANLNHSDENILTTALAAVNLFDVSTPSDFVRVFTDSVVEYKDGTTVSASVAGFLNGVSPIFGGWITDYYYTLPFLTVDKYSYATPPSHSYKSILWATIIGAAIVTGLTVVTMVGSKIIRKKISERRFLKGSELMREGEFFRDPSFQEQYKHMSDPDKAEYDRQYKSYIKRVRWFNKFSNLLGTSSLDWQNNWWNAYESSGAVVPTTGTGSSFADVLNTEAGTTATSAATAIVTQKLGVTDRLVESSIDDVLRVITGVTPQ